MTQAEAQAFESAFLKGVVDAGVTFPFVVGAVTRPVANIITTQVGHRSLQAWNTQSRKVIGVLTKGCILTGAGKLVDHAIGEQVEARAAVTFQRGSGAVFTDATLVQPDETTIITHLLVTEHQRMATQGVGEHGAPGLVVDLARVLRVATVVVEGIASLAILAVAAAVEVAQVSLERLVVGNLEYVGRTQEVLLVEVFQVRVVVLQSQVWGELVITAA